MEQNRDLRYPNEKPLFVILFVLATIIWLVLIVTIVGMAVGACIGIAIWFSHSLFIAYIKGNAVRISEQQFPDLHQQIQKSCQKLGLAQVPDAYILESGGFLNAFATRWVGRNFIVIYSDLVEACADEPGALDMIIGHEIGHLACNHLKYMWYLAPAKIFPLLGPAYSRACEYTCDRYGSKASETPERAIKGLAILSAGGMLGRNLNPESFAAQGESAGDFWMALHELISPYPFLCKRVAALQEFSGARKSKPASRHPFSYFFALFVPGMPGAAGGGFLMGMTVIGILAAAAIPKLMVAMDKARVGKCTADVTTVAKAAASFVKDQGRLPARAEELVPAYLSEIPAGVNYELRSDRQYLITCTAKKGETNEKSCIIYLNSDDGQIQKYGDFCPKDATVP